MYRRLSLSVFYLVLVTLFSLPALGQKPKDGAANKKIDEAINQHYLATNFDKAEQVLTGVVTACGDKCSGSVIAKAWMYVGIVRGSGKADQSGASAAFKKAIAADANVKLDAALATPETQSTFNALGGGGGGGDDDEDEKPKKKKKKRAPEGEDAEGGITCTPTVREVETRRPIPISCTTDDDVSGMELKYKEFGGDSFKSVRMKQKGDSFRATIPCDATGISGTIRIYVRDADGTVSWGSKTKPIEPSLVEKTDAEPPAFEGEGAPARCQSKGDCPPDFPGCGEDKPKRGGADWGAACANSLDCKSGLFCNEGTCESAPSCSKDDDCLGGSSCVGGKCEVAGGDDDIGTSAFKKTWIGVHFAVDAAYLGSDTQVCSKTAQSSKGYACYPLNKTSGQFKGTPYGKEGNVAGGFVFPATMRAMISLDRAISPNIMAGLRVGYAFGGGPPASAADFMPYHAELRLTYWFGRNVFSKKGPRFYIGAGGGLAQVDAKLTTKFRLCSPDMDPDTLKNCGAGKADPLPADVSKTYDAWKKMGTGFAEGTLGMLWAFGSNAGMLLNVNGMYMLPTSGIVLEPSLGFMMGL